MSREGVFIHPSAEVSPNTQIGKGTKIWMWCQVRENSEIGENVILSKSVYIDANVKIGNNVKIQNNVSVYQGVTISDGVFVGPHVCFTNDMRPRGINKDGSLKAGTDWTVVPTLIEYGAALGANSTIVCGVRVGKWAMVGSGSVVTRNVPDYGIVVGNPARFIGYVCPCGESATKIDDTHLFCSKCNEKISI